ncbi:hypothetical protein QBC42DRAFT_347326 [Cladorrhinum samala]|uniref:Uncharacterized protein n=1 Tax=Cladorrhinum samala TaxID=585594 RepID=A0AAV9HNZ4_9PEZI|nr:hypothetical protein QBC42DRAFT_347326 [Cladorrhinum samala]
MGIQVALYPTPVEQSESYAIRSLQLPPTPGRRLSSSSALSEEINTAFQINEDILYLPSTRFRADEKSTRRGTGNESFTLIPTTYNSNRTLKGKKTMGSSPGPTEQRKEYPETRGRLRMRRRSSRNRESPPTTEQDFSPSRLRKAVTRPAVDTLGLYRAASPAERKTPRSARYETARPCNAPRHPRPRHENSSEDENDRSGVGLYHKATGELARDQKAAEEQLLLKTSGGFHSPTPTHFPYSTAGTIEHLADGFHEESASDGGSDVWDRSSHFLLPPALPRPPRSNQSSSPSWPGHPSRRSSHDSQQFFQPVTTNTIFAQKIDSRSSQQSTHTFGKRGRRCEGSSSSSSSSSASQSRLSTASPAPPALISHSTTTTISGRPAPLSGALILTLEFIYSSLPSPSFPGKRNPSFLLSKVLKRISNSHSPPLTPTFATTPLSTPITTSFSTSTSISTSIFDMPIHNPHQVSQVHASLPPMNPHPPSSASAPSESSSGLSLASLAQKTRATFRTSEERRRAKLKSKIRVFGDGGTVLGLGEKGVEVVGVGGIGGIGGSGGGVTTNKLEAEMEQRRRAGAAGYGMPFNNAGSSSSTSNSSLSVSSVGKYGMETRTGTGAGLRGGEGGPVTGGMVFGKEITDSTGPDMWTGGRFGARAAAQNQVQQGMGMVRPFDVQESGKSLERKYGGGAGSGQQNTGLGDSGGLGGLGDLSGLSPPPPPPARALPRRPIQGQGQSLPAHSAGARYANARLGQVTGGVSKTEGQRAGGGLLMDARGNVVLVPEPDGVRPVL